MSSMIGARASPFSVSEYSTRGGTSGKVRRSTIPCSSSARSRSESVRGEIPSSERSSSEKRERPSARSRISRIVHFPERISAQAVTPQQSITSLSVVPAENCESDSEDALLDILERRSGRAARRGHQLEVVRRGGHRQRLVHVDTAGLQVTEQRLVEGLHAVVGALGDRLGEV